MADKVLGAKLQVRCDTEANFRTSNLTLLKGEMAISLDKGGAYKVGDGVNAWLDLPYNVALSAVSATSASSATYDTNGNAITSYLKSAEYDGHILTIVDGTGLPTTIVTADTTYEEMTGATASVAGEEGLVPAPSAGDNTKYLDGSGNWSVPTNTTYSQGTDVNPGLTKIYTTTGNNTDGSMTQAAITSGLNAKADASHTHGNADITAIDASKITTGVIDAARLPHGALDTMVIVADDTARFALTTSEVSNGDSVKVIATDALYVVVDDTNLDNASGYTSYTAGTATSVPWSGVTGKPAAFTPDTHTHANTDVTGLDNLLTGTAGYILQSNGANAPTWTQFVDGGDEGVA